jgi:large subunit ribosomal protein L25
METVNVQGQSRSLGSKNAKNIRKEGKIPCVLYGQDGTTHFATTHKDVKPLVYTPDFKLAEIDIDGSKVRTIIKDIQFHPVTDAIEHIDFLQLKDGVPVKVSIPLKTKGVSEGVKTGGKLIQQVRKILVKTLPEHLQEELYVDISSLELGQSARVRDIEVSEHMQIMNPPATPVVMVEVPRALRSAQTLAEGEEGTEEDVAAPAAE